MECPNCGERKTVELDTHSSGFTPEEQPVMECGACGLVWRARSVGDAPGIDIIKPATSAGK